jgi:hypothetical protein
MPDIMMCAAFACELSRSCYRHKNSGTKADRYRQSYWAREDGDPTGDECPHYWKATALVKVVHDGSMP